MRFYVSQAENQHRYLPFASKIRKSLFANWLDKQWTWPFWRKHLWDEALESRIVVFVLGFIVNCCLSRTLKFFFLLCLKFFFFFFSKTFASKVDLRAGVVIILWQATRGESFSVRQTRPGIWEYITFHSVSKKNSFAWQLICLINCCRSSVCTINPLILSSKCANIDPRRPYHSTLPSTVGPQRQYEKCGGLLFQVSSLNHHIILNCVIFSSFYDGCNLQPSGKSCNTRLFKGRWL